MERAKKSMDTRILKNEKAKEVMDTLRLDLTSK